MSTHYTGTKQETLALDTFIKLSRASETIHSHLAPHLARHDLTTGQFGTMEALYHMGEMAQVDIGRRLLKSPGNITVVLDNLERRGLVIRKRDRSDRRRLLVRLSDKGRDMIAAIFPKHLVEIVRCFDTLSESERKELGQLCRKLGRAVQDME